MHKFSIIQQCPFKNECGWNHNCLAGDRSSTGDTDSASISPYIPLLVTNAQDDRTVEYICEIKPNRKEKLANALSMVDELPQSKDASFQSGIPKITPYEEKNDVGGED